MTVLEPTTASVQLRRGAGPRPGDPLLLHVDGELEAATAAEFRAALAEQYAGAHGGPDVLLDLGRLYRLDPTGLNVIAEAAAELAREGRRLVLACVRPRVREFLSLAGGEALVPMFPNLEAAAQYM